MPHRASFDAATASIASKFTVTSAAAGSTASLFTNDIADWVAMAGFAFAGLSFLIQMLFTWRQNVRGNREDERRERESAAYLEALKQGVALHRRQEPS